MAESDDGFVRRWSQRKRKTRQDRRDADDPSAPGLPAEAAQEAALPAEAPDNLPDIDTLDESSDFTVFLKENVPDIIRRKALRKLWRLHPAIAVIDGLDDYDENFTDAATVIEGLKTLYKVGKGYADEEPAEAEAEEVAEAEGEELAESAGESDAVPEEEANESESEPENAQSAPAGKEKTTHVAEAEPANPTGRQAADNGESGAPAHPTRVQRRSARQRRWGQVVDK